MPAIHLFITGKGKHFCFWLFFVVVVSWTIQMIKRIVIYLILYLLYPIQAYNTPDI